MQAIWNHFNKKKKNLWKERRKADPKLYKRYKN